MCIEQLLEVPVSRLVETCCFGFLTKTCQQKIPTPEAPIVFTGAIVPFNLKQSDAFQNIIEAFASVKLLTNGRLMW